MNALSAPVRLQHKQEGQPGMTKCWRIETVLVSIRELTGAAGVALVALSLLVTLYDGRSKHSTAERVVPRTWCLRRSLRKGTDLPDRAPPIARDKTS